MRNGTFRIVARRGTRTMRGCTLVWRYGRVRHRPAPAALSHLGWGETIEKSPPSLPGIAGDCWIDRDGSGGVPRLFSLDRRRVTRPRTHSHSLLQGAHMAWR